MKAKRVVFVGVFGAGNLGNECTLQAAIEQTKARWPQASLQCVSAFPEDTQSRHSIPAFPLEARFMPPHARPRRHVARLLRLAFRRIPNEFAHCVAALRILRRTDVLIIAGTGIVNDYLTGPFGWPYDIFKWSVLAVCCRVKVLFLGIGVGPIYRPLSRQLIKMSLRMATYRSYRDRASQQYLEKIHFSTRRDRVYPDLAFGLPQRILPSPKPARQPPLVIGVGIKGPKKGDTGATNIAYLDAMAGFVSWLCANGYTVRLLVGDIEYDARTRQDFIQRLQSGSQHHLISEPTPTVEELLRQLQDTDAVISTRFHNLVLALLLGKPVIAISDHPKLDSLMDGLDLGRYCLHFDHLAVSDLIGMFTQLQSDIGTLQPYIAKKVDEYRAAVDEQFALAFARTHP
jgi:polysaccharide pyruvyl transferase WcaK-like protein